MTQATLIEGKPVAASVVAQVKRAAGVLDADKGVKPGLAVVIVGNDPASHTYVAAKSKMAKECGFASFQFTLPEETTQSELAELIERLNNDANVHGILVQLPLPPHLDSGPIVQSILPQKDVDGLGVVNAGKLAVGDLTTGIVPCTPAGAMVLVRAIHGPDLSGLRAVVIGRSNLFGKPMGQLLLAANATVTVAHSRTKDLSVVCREADILVAAVGRPQMVKRDWVKGGATVIDVGINRVPATELGEGRRRLVGDVAFEEVASVAGAVTPVPGGVGPMTIAMLMANTLKAAYRTAGESFELS
ncbi:bifunctional methylenetetrahydrofolate dehydrogenase/methenyltetrahydrofolate cyclohydrolase [Rhizobium leguminosarum bv. trifolii]|uniref:bifunctional methylenetetrahydrofolate dehydrogenase/methenyltetrahydrofolate cyclohydrolase FolD n=1 Tax=Rhizobium leguminosarum TaxID=384 RepID=UPI000E2E68C3|nr:bifunctional methylenetetrahydrofolate dehydrogenase/methenyltetrahydrofolate cyclohydrolase FolD [Rhizobium leguminosarum]RFB86883.1 bifunctional methylenetetrahydrofolate dehydrogenase/methenyltetrahydrofolate cyclohydrolase [Rhizobium leguminosarum bv. trifolii]